MFGLILPMEHLMNWKLVCVALSFPLLMTGCGAKESFVILTPAADGQVGALELATGKGSALLDEEGKAIFIRDRQSLPSEPTAMGRAETQEVFQDALRVQPGKPQSFLLYFRQDSDQLTTGSQKLVPFILETVRRRQSSDISIIGHTDRQGEDGYNRILAMERAEVVYDLLRSHDIKGQDMTILYHGAGNLLVPTGGEVAEPRNCRTEVMIR